MLSSCKLVVPIFQECNKYDLRDELSSAAKVNIITTDRYRSIWSKVICFRKKTLFFIEIIGLCSQERVIAGQMSNAVKLLAQY